jgi:hypothetical protein
MQSASAVTLEDRYGWIWPVIALEINEELTLPILPGREAAGRHSPDQGSDTVGKTIRHVGEALQGRQDQRDA